MKRIYLVVGAVFAAFVLVTALILTPASTDLQAAPFAAPTPKAYDNSNADPFVTNYFISSTITADTEICKDLSHYDDIDLHYLINQNTVNTVTLKMRHGNLPAARVDGESIVSANAADAQALVNKPLFGKWNCVNVDVTNSNPLTLSVTGVAK